jgi:hypothetical protein
MEWPHFCITIIFSVQYCKYLKKLKKYFCFFFAGVSDFEYTPECIIFDLLNISLYHGWLVDPQVNAIEYRPIFMCSLSFY